MSGDGLQGGAEFKVPRDQRYLEDYVEGATYAFDTPVSVSAREIMDFAGQFDPQPFHVDLDAAHRGPFAGLAASGWHTAALMMRLMVDNVVSTVGSLGGLGADELRWLKPVRPDQPLWLRATVLEARPSRSKPDRGVLRTRAELIDEAGEPVFSVVIASLVLRRPQPAG